MRVIGLNSGTSYDGIDIAALDLTFEGDAIKAILLGHSVVSYDQDLQKSIGAVLPPNPIDVGDVAKLDTLLGQAFAQAAMTAIEKFCNSEAHLVVSHGQTVFHWLENGQARGSLQIGEPAWIAELTGLPVVSGLRTRDISAGGQGAPLVGMVDTLLLSGRPGVPAALNIGGIANLSIVAPGNPIMAFDTGPGNALIDAAVLHYSDGSATYDADGAWAASGQVNEELLNLLLRDEYYTRSGPRSTGKEHFNIGYLLDAVEQIGDVPAADVVATVTQLTATTIASECRRNNLTEVIVSGGGADNPVLMRLITEEIEPTPIYRSDVLGIPSEAKEAVAFAVLGFLTFQGIPGTIPSCTGARRAVLLGNITPGATPLVLPTPSQAPHHMTVTGHA